MNTQLTSRLSKLLVVTSGSLATALGLLVVIGWHTHSELLINVRPNFVGMVYNSALSFILCGTGIIAIALNRPRWATPGGVLASAIGLLTLAEYQFGVDFGIDQLSMKHYINVANAYPGRMAVSTAALFFAAGAAISLLGAARRFRHRPLLVGVLGAACTVQGMVSFAGYFSGVATVYVWGDVARMAIHTAFGATLVGAGLLISAWRDQGPRQRSKDSYWLPNLVGLGVVTITLCMWQALIVQQRAQSELFVKTLAANLRNEIAEHMQIRMQALHRMAEGWEQNGKPSEESWKASAKLNLRDFPGLLAVWWTDSSFKELWTAQLSEKQISLDLNTILDHEPSIPVSFSHRDMARVTPAIDLGQNGKAFNIYVPVFERGQLSGFVIGTLDAKQLLGEAVAPGGLGRDYAITVLDGTTQIYGGDIGDRRSQQTKQKTEVKFPGTTWQIWVWPKAKTESQFGWNVPTATLIIGLLAVLVLSGSVRLAQNARRNARRAQKANQDMVHEIDERLRADADLRGLQEFQAAILSGVQHGIQGIDKAGRITFENPFAAGMLGWDANELIGKPAHATMHHHHTDKSCYPAEDCNIYATLHDGQPRRILDEAFWRQDGTSFPVEYSVAPMHSASGEVTGTVVVFDDISERKRAEEALRDSEERYRDLFENANDIIYTHDLQGNYTSVNKACERILGYTSEEALRMNIARLVAPERLEEARQLLAKRISGQTPSAYEMEIIAKDGHRVMLEVNSRLTYQDGQPSGVQGMARDITERKRAEEALKASEVRFQNAFDHAPTGITLVAPVGRFLQVNESFCDMVGYTKEELLALDFQFITHPDDLAASNEIVQQLLAGDFTTVQLEKRYLHKLGHEVCALTHLSLVQDAQASPLYVIAQMQDISERKRAEAERQAIAEIVQGVITTSNLDELFSLAHQSISKLLYAENCFIALYDKTSDLLHIPFCKDEFDPVAAPQKLGRGLTAFVLRRGRPMLLTPELIQELVSKGEIELVGTLPAAWLGVPLRTSTDTIGVLVVQHYEDKEAYSQQDLELLATVGDQLGLAIQRKQIEVELKTNEMRLTEAQHIANLGNWEWDVVTDSVRWSNELYRIFGLQPDEPGPTFGKFLTYVHPDDRKLAERAIAEAFRDKVLPNYDYRIIRPDGTVRALQCRGEVGVDETGGVTNMWGTVQDITDRKRAEEVLRESEERYRLLFESNPQPMWVYDLETLAFLAVNESAVNHYGYSREEFLAMTIKDIRPAGIPALEDSFARSSERVDVAAIWRHLKKDGTIFDAEITSHLLVFDDRRAELILAHDITERRRAEAERQVISEIVQGVVTTANLDELFKLAHKAISKLLYAENLFIALDDPATGLLHFEYWVDKFDPVPLPRPVHKGFSGHVLRTGQPLMLSEELKTELLGRGEVERKGTGSASWMGVPLRTHSRTIGVLVVQHYEKKNAYSRQDLEFLAILGDQLGLAIERKRAEEALIESDRRFRDLFYDAPVGYHELDTEGRITCVNTTELLMLGYSSEEMIGRQVWDFIEEPEIARQTFADKIAGNKPLRNVERCFRRKDGTLMDVQLDDQMLKDPGGRTIGIRATMQDIGERKRTEAALTQSEQRFRDLFENASDVIYTADFDGNFTSLNKSGERMTGYTREEALELNFSQVVSPETFKMVREMTERKLRSPDETVYELEFFKKSGEPLLVEVSSRAIYANGKPVGIQGIGRDITQRKQVEAEQKLARDVAIESVRLKSEFLANMSHEIRTPMNGVIGMTGLLLDTDLDEEQRDCAETIRTSGEALLTIINDILDFSKMEAGKLHFETLDFLLNNVVEDTIELLAERAHQKKIEFASLIYNDVPTGLRGDPGRLRQVLTNLIGNAIKFTERGEVIVHVEKESETNDDVVVRFMVSDTGIGISEAAQQNLFQAFTQADGSTTRKYGGTGLGLAISKQLVGLMGGEMGVTSTLGQGSAFWFTARYDKQIAGAVIPLPQPMSLEKLRVLIVDDNATNRKILSHQLGSWGMIHQQADSGFRALELLRSAAAAGTPYDLAVLDLMMPGMDGFEMARTIKSDPSIAGMHLVMLTSFGERGDGATARETGVAAYLTKPVRQSQLFDCLANVISAAAITPERQVTSSQPVSKVLTKHTLKEARMSSNKLILLAEDNIVNQKVAIRQLQKLGYRADAVANGREAIEALSRISYDLVLMDCQMPEMDGYEATAEIRRQEGETRHTPIVAMTAHALTGDREKCIAAGMDEYITKPVKPEELSRVLELFFKTPSTDSGEQPGPMTAPLVDVDRMHEMMGDAPVEFDEIVNLYLDQMGQNLHKLDAAVASGNHVEVELIAHNCAGTSANCGMKAVAIPFRELEDAGRTGCLENAPAVLAQANRLFEETRACLTQHMAQAVS